MHENVIEMERRSESEGNVVRAMVLAGSLGALIWAGALGFLAYNAGYSHGVDVGIQHQQAVQQAIGAQR